MTQTERHGGEADLSAIDRVRDAHVAALNANDSGAWAAQFADDGVQMPPHAPANVGKAMIGPWSHGLLSHFRVQFALSVDEVRVLGEWAFERGGYTIDLNPTAGGPPMRDSGQVRHDLPKKARRHVANGARHLEQQSACARDVSCRRPRRNEAPSPRAVLVDALAERVRQEQDARPTAAPTRRCAPARRKRQSAD